jgi:hypothetical protein
MSNFESRTAEVRPDFEIHHSLFDFLRFRSIYNAWNLFALVSDASNPLEGPAALKALALPEDPYSIGRSAGFTGEAVSVGKMPEHALFPVF